MPDYFQTQSDRAQQAYQRGWEKESAVHRVDRQLRSVQRIDAMGSASAQASKARAIAALNSAKQMYKRAEDFPPSAAAVSLAKARRVARGQLVAARADLSIAVIELLRATAKPIADAMESLTVPIAERAIDGWPVQSGRSRDAIMCNVQMSGTVVSFTMSNDAPYIYYIKQGKWTTSDKRILKRGQAAWVTLIRTPMYRAADKVAARIKRRFREM